MSEKPFWWALRTLFVCAITLALLESCVPHDDTDPPDGRSGLGLKKDNLTGCEYLVTWSGGITPRMNAEGEQVCR